MVGVEVQKIGSNNDNKEILVESRIPPAATFRLIPRQCLYFYQCCIRTVYLKTQ